MIMKPVALQCVIGGSCQFRTMKLEFGKAFQLLDLHMKYLHTLKANDERVDKSEHDKKTEEDNFVVEQPVDDTESSSKVCVETDPVVEKSQSDSANVTSVSNDRSVENQGLRKRNHDRNPVDDSQANFPDVTLASDDHDEINHPCGCCGGNNHSSNRASRRKFCPAWNKLCGLCNRRGHLQNMCKTTFEEHLDEFEGVKEEDNTDLTFGEIAGLVYGMSQIAKINKLKVPHMLHDQLQWTLSHPPPQPFINLQVRVDTKAYRYHNWKPPSPYRHRSTEIPVLADSGCQACCMGPRELNKLGLNEKDLLEVEMKLNGANGSQLRIMGGVFLVISGNDGAGKLWETNQLCYVAEGVEKLLLSKEACVKLGILPKSFPSVGSAIDQRPVVSEVSDGPNTDQFDLEPCAPDEDGSCSCPRRESVPEPPVFDHNLSVSQLRRKIIQHYAASAFNKCTRQTLPLMRGEPLPIPVKKDVKPVAVHTPVPVPLHWEEKVYKDLMRDVALGVIEPVPINTPVTWCHRMVTVPKHNGDPRRTVDMQSLNKASVRQTHPTRSPFMLASSVPAGKTKSVLDVWNSFHSVPLMDEDRDKTTFITPWGRFRYRVSPQGYLA